VENEEISLGELLHNCHNTVLFPHIVSMARRETGKAGLARLVGACPECSEGVERPASALKRAANPLQKNRAAALLTTPPTGQVWRSYYYAAGQRVAMRVRSSATNEVYYLLGDPLGSTSVVVNASGSKVSEQRYAPWGETRFSSGTMPTKYTFTGQYSYANGGANDFGLLYYNARWYDNSSHS